MDLTERRELLYGVCNDLRNRIHNARQPAIMLDHAAALRAQAAALIDKADAIERGVRDDCDREEELLTKLRNATLEIRLLDVAIANRVKPSGLRKLLEVLKSQLEG